MDEDEVVTVQIRQLTLTDRLKSTDAGDVPALDTPLPDCAAGESGNSKARTGADGEGLDTDVRDESELKATDELRPRAQAPERLNSNTGQSIIPTEILRQMLEVEPESGGEAQSPFDTTIAEVRPFTKREPDDYE